MGVLYLSFIFFLYLALTVPLAVMAMVGKKPKKLGRFAGIILLASYAGDATWLYLQEKKRTPTNLTLSVKLVGVLYLSFIFFLYLALTVPLAVMAMVGKKPKKLGRFAGIILLASYAGDATWLYLQAA